MLNKIWFDAYNCIHIYKTMNKFFLSLALACSLTTLVSAQVHQRGYAKHNGTYVEPTERTRPNRTNQDNYSNKGNVNPYNGNVGTAQPTYTGDQQIYTGPRGGTYIIDNNGNKRYVKPE